LTRKSFSKKQLEECREFKRQASTAEDRAFWLQAAERWQEQLRQAQTQTAKKATRPGKRSFKYSAEA